MREHGSPPDDPPLTESGKTSPESDGDGRDTLTFREELRQLYRDLDEELARHAPVCAVSGRCCRFQEYGHTLFLSAPETAQLLDEAPPAVRPLDDGESCPWQNARGLCQAREARPLGCRVYFCDPRFEPFMSAITETYVTRMKALVTRYGLDWDYAPLHRHLRQAQNAGRWSGP